jgi:hypothetical protein
VDAQGRVATERGRKSNDFDGAGGLRCFTPPPTSNGISGTFLLDEAI